jgi:hypothetical protein
MSYILKSIVALLTVYLKYRNETCCNNNLRTPLWLISFYNPEFLNLFHLHFRAFFKNAFITKGGKKGQNYPCAYLIKYNAMKTWGSGGIAPPFLTWALDWIDGHTLARQLCPRRKSPRYPLYRSLEGPRSRSGYCEKEKISYLCRKSNSDRLNRSPSLYLLSCPGSS